MSGHTSGKSGFDNSIYLNDIQTILSKFLPVVFYRHLWQPLGGFDYFVTHRGQGQYWDTEFRFQGGPRRVTSITEVVGMEQDTVIMQDIYKYVQEGIDETGRARGRFESTGIRPTFMSRLEAAGVRLPASAFRQRVMMVD